MNTNPSAAERAQLHETPPPADEAAAQPRLFARVKHALRAAMSAAASALSAPGRALLRRLRKQETGDADAKSAENTDEPAKNRPHARHDEAQPAAPPAAPQPRRHLRAVLIHLGVLVAGGMGGGALAYNLLGTLLYQQFEKSRHLAVENSKLSRAAAAARKKLETAETERLAAAKKFEEEKKKLEALLAAERARNAPMLAASDGTARPLKTGECALSKGNLASLKSCIEDFNR
ncbi:MAG: hypothetical protein ACK4N4_15820 [Burkholderiales bacterium]